MAFLGRTESLVHVCVAELKGGPIGMIGVLFFPATVSCSGGVGRGKAARALGMFCHYVLQKEQGAWELNINKGEML